MGRDWLLSGSTGRTCRRPACCRFPMTPTNLPRRLRRSTIRDRLTTMGRILLIRPRCRRRKPSQRERTNRPRTVVSALWTRPKRSISSNCGASRKGTTRVTRTHRSRMPRHRKKRRQPICRRRRRFIAARRRPYKIATTRPWRLSWRSSALSSTPHEPRSSPGKNLPSRFTARPWKSRSRTTTGPWQTSGFTTAISFDRLRSSTKRLSSRHQRSAM